MCDMVLDAGWIHSIDARCRERSCECGAMLGGGGRKPRGSRQGEWSCGVGEGICMTWSLMQNESTALMLAASNFHVNVVQCLVVAGANPEAVNKVSGHVVWEYVDV